MPSDIIKHVSEHLEFLGYKVTKDEEEASYERFLVEPFTEDARKLSFSIVETEAGPYFLAGFPVSSSVEKDPLGLLQLLNEANIEAYVAKFTWNREKDGLFAEGCYSPVYDKRIFASFITTWLNEVAFFFSSKTPHLRNYLRAPAEE